MASNTKTIPYVTLLKELRLKIVLKVMEALKRYWLGRGGEIQDISHFGKDKVHRQVN